MSESYPSRRELRLQREREARAKLRDEEAQRWASEIAQRGAGASPDEPSQPDEDQPTDVEETGRLGRRASASPIDTPAEGQEDATAAPQGARRRRRADSEVTSTGMIPIITNLEMTRRLIGHFRVAKSANSKPVAQQNGVPKPLDYTASRSKQRRLDQRAVSLPHRPPRSQYRS